MTTMTFTFLRSAGAALLLGAVCTTAYANSGYVSFIGTLLFMNMGTRLVEWICIAPFLSLALMHVLRYTTPNNSVAPYLQITVVLLLSGILSIVAGTLVSAPAAFFIPILTLPLFVATLLALWLFILTKYQARLVSQVLAWPTLALSLWVAASLVFSAAYVLYHTIRFFLRASGV